MQFCQDHWTRLRKCIEERGLTSLVPNREAGMHMIEVRADGMPPDDVLFDPLMGAHNAMLMRALEFYGFGLMMPDENGNERCPLCEVKKTVLTCKCGMEEHTEERAESVVESWLNGSSDAMMREAAKRGLVSKQ